MKKINAGAMILLLLAFASAALLPPSASLAGIGDVQRSLGQDQPIGQGGSQAPGMGSQSGDDTGVIMCDTLNVRSAPWGEIIGTIKKGTKVDIQGHDGEWLKIKYHGRDAYIHSGYVSTKSAPSSAFTGYVNVDNKLNVRSAPWGQILGTLGRGHKVEILGKQGDWYKIRYNGKDAFVHSKYISKNKVEARDDGGNNAPSSPGGTTNAPAGKAGLSHPLTGAMSIGSKYGMRMHPIYHVWKMHNGVDIGRPTGTPLLAMGNGKVIFSGWASGAGYMIKIKYDNGYTSTYMHCLPSGAKPVGARVDKGQQVAKVNNTGGSTGPHLHLEITNPSGARINPANVL